MIPKNSEKVQNFPTYFREFSEVLQKTFKVTLAVCKSRKGLHTASFCSIFALRYCTKPLKKNYMINKKLLLTKNKISMNPTMNAPLSKGRVYEQSLEKYFELTEQEDLAKLVSDIRHAENHDERRNLKANPTCPSVALTTSASRTIVAVRLRSSQRHSPGRPVSISTMPVRWKEPSLARTFLIMKRVPGKTRCSTWSIRHPASCTSTSASHWA